MEFASRETGKSKAQLWGEMLRDSFKYNISLLEYFQFGFYKGLSDKEKDKWAGTGYMYEYQKLMNPPGKRDILDDKTLFYKKYKSYFKHHILTLDEMRSDHDAVKQMLNEQQLVLKESKGKCGLGVAFVNFSDFSVESLIDYMDKKGFDLAESYINQHIDLNRLSPSGVNTVRIFTQLNEKDEVEILGCRQRISVDSPVDNLAAGNLAAPINEEDGVISGPGVYSDITKKEKVKHPITGTAIVGFKVPYWEDCLQLAKKAALEHKENRSIGWDIVVTENGPGLIEGNHDWCKLVWQLPVKEGMKGVLEEHVRRFRG
jgi:hypothetical protein